MAQIKTNKNFNSQAGYEYNSLSTKCPTRQDIISRINGCYIAINDDCSKPQNYNYGNYDSKQCVDQITPLYLDPNIALGGARLVWRDGNVFMAGPPQFLLNESSNANLVGIEIFPPGLSHSQMAIIMLPYVFSATTSSVDMSLFGYFSGITCYQSSFEAGNEFFYTGTTTAVTQTPYFPSDNVTIKNQAFNISHTDVVAYYPKLAQNSKLMCMSPYDILNNKINKDGNNTSALSPHFGLAASNMIINQNALINSYIQKIRNNFSLGDDIGVYIPSLWELSALLARVQSTYDMTNKIKSTINLTAIPLMGSSIFRQRGIPWAINFATGAVIPATNYKPYFVTFACIPADKYNIIF